MHEIVPREEPPAMRDGEGAARRVGAFLARRWVVIILTLAVVLTGSEIALRLLPPHFTARAEVLLDPRREKSFGPDDTFHLISLDASDVESAIVLIKGGALLSRVVADQRLVADPEYGARPADVPRWRTLLAPLVLLRQGEPHTPDSMAVAALSKGLRVDRIGKSYALSIAVTALDPQKAARLANAVADAFVRDQREAHLEASRRAAAFFAERLGPLGEQLKRSEETLARFRRDHDLIAKTVSAQGQANPATINEQQVVELNTRLAGARVDTAQAWARYDQAQVLQARGGLVDSVPEVVRSTVIGRLREQQAEVARKEADLAVLWRKRQKRSEPTPPTYEAWQTSATNTPFTL